MVRIHPPQYCLTIGPVTGSVAGPFLIPPGAVIGAVSRPQAHAGRPRTDFQFFLFDLATDPGERTDLAARRPDLVRPPVGQIQAWGQRRRSRRAEIDQDTP